jgi:peptidoglycan-associated lipoprotein
LEGDDNDRKEARMVREARELHRKRGSASMISWRGPLLGLILLLPVALLLSGCPKKPEVGTGGPAAVAPAPAEPMPAPEAKEEVVIVEEKAEVMVAEEAALQDAFFDFDKSVIRPDTKQALDENIVWLHNNLGVRIVVEGHCDERGTNEYNLALGERRAKAVRDYLVAGGIDRDRISTISYGEERPFCLGHDESAWQCNRRGHFVVVQ